MTFNNAPVTSRVKRIRRLHCWRTILNWFWRYIVKLKLLNFFCILSHWGKRWCLGEVVSPLLRSSTTIHNTLSRLQNQCISPMTRFHIFSHLLRKVRFPLCSFFAYCSARIHARRSLRAFLVFKFLDDKPFCAHPLSNLINLFVFPFLVPWLELWRNFRSQLLQVWKRRPVTRKELLWLLKIISRLSSAFRYIHCQLLRTKSLFQTDLRTYKYIYILLHLQLFHAFAHNHDCYVTTLLVWKMQLFHPWPF